MVILPSIVFDLFNLLGYSLEGTIEYVPQWLTAIFLTCWIERGVLLSLLIVIVKAVPEVSPH